MKLILPIIILLLLVVFLALFLGKTSITVSPFSIHVARPITAVGYTLLAIGFVVLIYGVCREGGVV
jgi:hypothetical protein